VPVADFTIYVLLMDPGESCLMGGSGTLLLDRQASISAQQFATVGTTARIDTAAQHTLCDPFARNRHPQRMSGRMSSEVKATAEPEL
jgi:hypothetical protein